MPNAYKTTLPLLTSATASAKGSPFLESAQKTLGFVPNVYGAIANSPGLLETDHLGHERSRNGTAIPDAKPAALFSFIRHLLRTRCRSTVEAAKVFIAAGSTDKQALQIILAIAVKPPIKYPNHIFGSPVDDGCAQGAALDPADDQTNPRVWIEAHRGEFIGDRLERVTLPLRPSAPQHRIEKTL